MYLPNCSELPFLLVVFMYAYTISLLACKHLPDQPQISWIFQSLIVLDNKLTAGFYICFISPVQNPGLPISSIIFNSAASLACLFPDWALDTSHKYSCSLYISANFTVVSLPHFASIFQQAEQCKYGIIEIINEKQDTFQAPLSLNNWTRRNSAHWYRSSRQTSSIPVTGEAGAGKASMPVNRTVFYSLTYLHTKSQYFLCYWNKVMLLLTETK